MSDEPNFTRSCYATDADLYKAKAAYYEAKFDSLTAELNNHDYKLGTTVKALQAKVAELEALNKMHLPNVELLHKILTQRPYPSGAEWQFLEAWADQFIRLNKPSAPTQEGE